MFKSCEEVIRNDFDRDNVLKYIALTDKFNLANLKMECIEYINW